MQIWTFLHILTMFAAVTIVAGAELFLASAAYRRDPVALRAYFGIAKRVDLLGGIFLGLGIIFGIIAAIVIGWDLLSGWLLVAYVLVALTFIVDGVFAGPHRRKLEGVVTRSPTDGSSSGILEGLDPRPLMWSTFTVFTLIALIIADMVFKPTF